MAQKPKFALALGGGGARGIAHIHILEVLDEMGIKPVAIAGSSIGSLMGAAYASGMSGVDIRRYMLDIMTNRLAIMNRLWAARGTQSSRFKFFPLDAERVVHSFLSENIKSDFDDLLIPLTVAVADFYTQKPIYLKSGALHSALAASCALPGIFQPVRYNDNILVDGGLADPVPFEILQNTADYVIAVDVVGAPQKNDTTLPSTVDTLFGASQLMMQTIISLKLTRHQPALFLRPCVHKYRVLDFLKASDILETTKGVRDELRTQIEAILVRH